MKKLRFPHLTLQPITHLNRNTHNFLSKFKLTQNHQRLYHFSKTNFCQKEGYTEYQSPETQEIRLYTLGQRVLLLLFQLTAGLLFIKYVFLTKYNQISKRRLPFVISDYYEHKLGNYLSKRIQRTFSDKIYKSDTEEVDWVYNVYINLLKKNKISFAAPIDKEKVFVIDSPSIGAFLLTNGDLFISNRVLELSSCDDELAFLISTELANLIMGKVSERLWRVFKNDAKLWLKMVKPETHKAPKQDFNSYLQEKESHINRFLLFYPESAVNTYYEEIEVCKVALKLLNIGGYDLSKVNRFVIHRV
jgi:hypothetical protein